MSEETSQIRFTGDLVLDLPDADYWLEGSAPALRQAALTIGHIEVPHTAAASSLEGDIPAPGAPLENIASLHRAGFDCVTLAGNHIADCGAKGIRDTISELHRNSVVCTGRAAHLKRPGHRSFRM